MSMTQMIPNGYKRLDCQAALCWTITLMMVRPHRGQDVVLDVLGSKITMYYFIYCSLFHALIQSLISYRNAFVISYNTLYIA